jgi:hypothetical protein
MLPNFKSFDRWIRRLLLTAAIATPAVAVVPSTDFESLPADGLLSSEDGVVTLAWTPLPVPWEVELQQGVSPDFADPVVRYRGRDTGSVLTGLPEGTHFFRIRAIHPDGSTGAWREAAQAEVTFMDRGRLFLLLSLGGIVVLATAGAIIGGYLSHRGESKAEGEA